MSSCTNYDYKQIHDAVHNTIGLSEVEVDIINTRAFQRLRNVKQLGLANYVFPGADYTRFSHSIGVCHLTGKMYDAYRKVKPPKPEEQIDVDIEKQQYRLAGLLHDIGHYALSHSMEEAIELYLESIEDKQYSSAIIKKTDTKGITDDINSPDTRSTVDAITESYLKHESVGREILVNDNEIKQVLSNHGFTSEDIYPLFTRSSEINNTDIANLISSDLDADRLDYLLRSAHYVGLPYGSTDIEYILRQIAVDDDGKICLHSKALRTVDHFLLCRYFDYSQVVFHKTVAGFEQVLKKVIAYLLEKKVLIYSQRDIVNSIKLGKWYEYDDAHVLKHIRAEYEKDSVPYDIRLMMQSILERKPPKEVVKIEYISDLGNPALDKFLSEIEILENLRADISTKFDISPNNICVWNNGRLKITKATKTINISKTMEMTKNDYDNINQSVRIHDRLTGLSKPIMEREDSLMRILSEKCLYSARLYVILDPTRFNGKDLDEHVEKIREYIQKKNKHMPWV